MYNADNKEVHVDTRVEGGRTYRMEKSKEKNSGKRKRRNKRKAVIAAVSILIVITALVCIYVWNRAHGEPYDSFETVWSGTLNRNAAIEYLPYSNGYMKVSRDGAEAVNSYGSLAWNVSYDMNNPVAATCRECAVVGDFGNKIVYMMDGTGSLYWKNVPYPIREVETSAVGVVAVRMNDGMSDYIQLITLAGEVLVAIKTLENQDGFPVDIALSEDGTKLATSYLVIDDGKADGWIAFYNFGEVGQNYANNLAGVYKYEEVIPEIRFMDNDTLCAFRKEGVDIFHVPELPERIAEISCDAPILQVSTSKDYLGILTDNTKAGTVARAAVYDKKGQLVFDRTIVEQFDAFLITGDDLVLYSTGACLVMNLNGTLKFNGLLVGRNVREIMPAGERDKLMLFEEESVTTIQFVHAKEE